MENEIELLDKTTQLAFCDGVLQSYNVIEHCANIEEIDFL